MEKKYVCDNCGWTGNSYINPPYSDIWFQSRRRGIFAAGLAGEKVRGICPNCKKKTIKVDINKAVDNISLLPRIIGVILILAGLLLGFYEAIRTL